MIVTLKRHAQPLRYGENPHQSGALYVDRHCTEPSVAAAEQLHGKDLSFNNLYDASGAFVQEFQGAVSAMQGHDGETTWMLQHTGSTVVL